jgi:hypothetical protein
MVILDAVEFDDWYIEAMRCAACGTDCQHEQDAEAHTQYGLCSSCLAECEAGERCWECLSRSCSCGPDDSATSIDSEPTVDSKGDV